MLNNLKIIGNNIFAVDLRFLLFLVKIEEKISLSAFFKLLTKVGDGYLYGVIGIIEIFLLGSEGIDYTIALLAAFAIELPIYKIVKNSFRRMRPFDKVENLNYLIQPPDKYSFPSGHTAAAFIIAAILSHQFSEFTSVLYIWAFLTGISRIYLRVHFPTDVLFGIILGLYSAQFGLWLVF